MELSSAYRNGASWFFWLAALSMVNSVLAVSGANIRMIFGLGYTQITDAILGVAFEGESSGIGAALSLATSAVVAGLFALIGLLAHKGFKLAYIGGLVLYVIDALVLLGLSATLSLWGDLWLDLLFHAFVLFQLVVGLTSRAA